MTETDLMPNPVAVDSERAEGKSKKREGLWKPKSELPPNRIAEISTGDFAESTAGGFRYRSRYHASQHSCAPAHPNNNSVYPGRFINLQKFLL